MADRVKKVNYLSLKVPNRAGQGARILSALKDGGVSLSAYSGFPVRGGAQLDFVSDNLGRVRSALRKLGLRPAKNKKAFLIEGEDRLGAVHKHAQRLADQRINIVSAQAICAGKKRYGMILWVRPGDYSKAAKALKAK